MINDVDDIQEPEVLNDVEVGIQNENVIIPEENNELPLLQNVIPTQDNETIHEDEDNGRRYPERLRNKPKHFEDYYVDVCYTVSNVCTNFIHTSNK